MARPFRIPPALLAADVACVLAVGVGFYLRSDAPASASPALAWTLIVFGGLGLLFVAVRLVQLVSQSRSP